MNNFSTAGVHSALLRCYRIGMLPQVNHLESTARFETMGEVRNALKYHNDPRGLKALLVVHRDHLPKKFAADLQAYEIFTRFGLRAVGFTDDLTEAQVSAYNPLPSAADDGSVSWRLSAGFPVTASIDRVDLTCAFSFGHEEQRQFLGSFYPSFSGHMIILNLRSQFAAELRSAELARTAGVFARELAPRPALIPFIH